MDTQNKIQREIKFRVWCKYHNSFEPHNIMIGLTGEIYHEGKYAPNDYILIQFTGLKDKNGKEIWEGDIANITYTCMRFSHWMRITDRGVMEWVNKSAQFSFLVKDSILDEDMQDLEVEVIGNIYENPELLRT